MGDFLSNVPLILTLLSLAVGTFLIVIEVFLPGIGIPGITGLLLSIFGLAALVAKIGWLAIFAAMLMLAVILGALYYMSRSMQKGKKNPLILNSQINENRPTNCDLCGKQGYTLTPLRPAGIVVIEEEQYDVLTSGEFIDKNTTVTVAKVLGHRIIVKQDKGE